MSLITVVIKSRVLLVVGRKMSHVCLLCLNFNVHKLPVRSHEQTTEKASTMNELSFLFSS